MRVGFANKTAHIFFSETLTVRRERAQSHIRVLGGSCLGQVHGANPGLISHFVKQALLNIAADEGVTAAADYSEPRTRREWAALAQHLGVQVMHIAERDTQVASIPKRRGEFVNTWSVDGFVSEGTQPSELGTAHVYAVRWLGSWHVLGAGQDLRLRRGGTCV
jgi:homospermidine synthase